MEIPVRSLVDVSSIGPARVAEVTRSGYKIECFISPWKSEIFDVARNNVRYLKLPLQTRVYVKIDGMWKMGRVVLEHERSDGRHSYDIQFPNSHESRHDEEDVYCRCWFPPDDPTTTLATGGMETQFWHDRRQGFAETLLAQRAACRGLSALISSRIELVPHQLEVARRILEDPLQRYLLADEVGMGKTIEAGLVIRQFLLSHSTGQVLVVVPKGIVRQWQLELEEKFIISEFPERVNIVSATKFESLDIDIEDLSLFVVDEAHNLVADNIKPKIQEVANTTPRLLLLSATPSLGDPQTLLKLLQLIDPDCYRDVTVEAFSQRVAKREELGVFLRGLRSDASPAILRQRLRRIPELLPEDNDAHDIAADISAALASGEIGVLQKKINELRAHVADVHRIHHRLVRTRRCDAAGWVFSSRGPGKSDRNTSNILVKRVNDSRFTATLDIFEQWRVEMAVLASQKPSLSENIISCFITLFEALGCGVDCFARTIDAVPNDLIDREWRNAFRAAVDCEEVELTRAMQVSKVLRQYVDSLQNRVQGRSPRIVVFGSDSKDVKECAEAFISFFGVMNVFCSCLTPIPVVEFLRSQEFSNNFCALFCSRNEEEGLNLNMFDAVVHLDLPFSPTRMEQRIGRLDRFGRKTHVPELIILPETDGELNPWEAWHEVLSEGFNIFDEPVADVQFALQELLSILAESFLVSGTKGLRDSIQICQEYLSRERDRLDNQYALDQVFQNEDAAGGLFEVLDDLEGKEDEITEAIKAWAIDALQLSCEGDYRKIFRLHAHNALMPAMLRWATIFRNGLIGNMTFKRRLALNPPNGVSRPQLLRAGSPLLFALESLHQWDDRGRAFATWRRVANLEGERLAFKLSYAVECRLPEGLSEDEEQSLRPRGDGYLAPWSEDLYLDVNFNVIKSPALIRLLATPYKARNGDYNLGSRLDSLYRIIEPVQFEKLCHAVRKRSEAWLRESPTYKNRIAESVERGQLDINKRNRRLMARRNACAGNGELEDTGISRSIEINTKLSEVLQNPLVKLEAIGLFVLSSRTPDDFE